MNKIYLFVPLIVLVSIGTSFSQPSWVKKATQKYPDRMYIVGIGFANKTKDRASDLQKAYDAAFADISKQIKSTVSSQISSKEYEVLSGSKNSVEQQTSAEIQVTSDVKLGGLKIVETYEDDDNELEWAIAILDRTAASDQLKASLSEYLGLYRQALASSRNAINSGDIYQSMLGLDDALKSQVWYNDVSPLYNFIAGPLVVIDSAYLMPSQLSVADTRGVLQTILTGLRLEKIGGDTQSVSIRGSYKPLMIGVTYSDGKTRVAVAGVKLSFSFRNGSGKLTASAATDKNGIAECDVYSLTPYSGNTYSIAAVLDLSDFAITGGQTIRQEFQDWDAFLNKYSSGVTFIWKKSNLSFQDKLADAILLLNSKLTDTSASITVSKILYQDKVAGPMAEFLRQQIESTVESSTNLSVISEDAVRASQVELSNSGYPQSLSQPDYASGAAGAKYVVTGNYWQEGEKLDLSLKVIDVNTHVIMATSSSYLELASLPKVDLAPGNYNPTADANLTKTETKGEDTQSGCLG